MSHTGLIAPLVLSIFVSGLFTSCNTKSRQQKLAIQETVRLRDQFNSGACSSIAASAESSDNSVKTEWQRGCEELHENLVHWVSFGNVQATTLEHSGKTSTVRVEGLALFGNGENRETYWLESYWHVTSTGAKIYFFHLAGGDKQFSLPHAPPPMRREMDLPTNPVSSMPSLGLEPKRAEM